MKREDCKSITALGADIDIDNMFTRVALCIYSFSPEEIDKYILQLKWIRDQVAGIQELHDNVLK